MDVDIKKVLKDKDPSLIFNIILMIVVLVWLGWFYSKSLSKMEVETNGVEKPVINIDKSAYSKVEGYFETINSYELPDFTVKYDNPEPFTEYSR